MPGPRSSGQGCSSERIGVSRPRLDLSGDTCR